MAAGQQCVGGLHDQLGDVEVRVGDPARVGEQLERLLEVVRRLVRAADRAGLVAGLDAGGEGGLEVHGHPGVAGQLGRRTPGAALAEGVGVRRVQPDPLAGQQVVVHRLPQQRVPERVVPLAGDEHVHLDRLPQALVERGRGESGGGGEHLVGDLAAGDARGPDDLPRVVVDPVEPDQQHVGEVVGQPATGSARGGDELLHEERVALGPLDDVGDLGLVEDPAELGDEGTDVGRRQGGQLQPVDAADPGPLGDLAAQGVAAVQVVGAVRRHDRDRAAERPGEQEAEHVARRLVGPVRVLDDQQHRG